MTLTIRALRLPVRAGGTVLSHRGRVVGDPDTPGRGGSRRVGRRARVPAPVVRGQYRVISRISICRAW